MTDFEFVDELPSLRRDDILLREFAQALKARPGVWAKYPQDLKARATAASRINTGVSKVFADGYQATVREGVLYVRAVTT